MKKLLTGTLALFFLAMMALGLQSPVAAPGRITLCHLADSNKYIEITVANNATLGGHIAHEGDIIPAPGQGCPCLE